MNLHYCKKCDDILPLNGEHPGRPCLVCRTPLSYFGREKATISTQKLLNDFDDHHPFNPVKDYQGRYFTDRNVVVQDTDIAACLDVLRFTPKNIDALTTLAKLYQVKDDWMLAKQSWQKIITIDASYQAAYQNMASIYVMQKQYDQALDTLHQLLSITPTALPVIENIAKIHAMLGDTKQALKRFYQAYHLAKTDQKKQRIKTLIRRLS